MEKLTKQELSFVMLRDIPDHARFHKWLLLRIDDILKINEKYGFSFTMNNQIMIPYEVYELYYNDIENGGEIKVNI